MMLAEFDVVDCLAFAVCLFGVIFLFTESKRVRDLWLRYVLAWLLGACMAGVVIVKLLESYEREYFHFVVAILRNVGIPNGSGAFRLFGAFALIGPVASGVICGGYLMWSLIKRRHRKDDETI